MAKLCEIMGNAAMYALMGGVILTLVWIFLWEWGCMGCRVQQLKLYWLWLCANAAMYALMGGVMSPVFFSGGTQSWYISTTESDCACSPKMP